ncbi:hypothetical protein KY335_00855 [Candidatus Woesearchaeota archaeon]|nr:hypothetical protein [Candidatus Woesearchaeota archaeon]
MNRRILCLGLLLVLLIYMTGCLYPPEPCEEKAPAPVVKEAIQPVVQQIVEEKEAQTIEEIQEEEQKEENKTSMDSSEFTVNPTLDDSALTNSS